MVVEEPRASGLKFTSAISHSQMLRSFGPGIHLSCHCADGRRGGRRWGFGDTTNGRPVPLGKPWDRQPNSGKLRRKLVSVPGLRREAGHNDFKIIMSEMLFHLDFGCFHRYPWSDR